MNKKALITGISGQVGSYLAEILIAKGYDVHGFDMRQFMGYDALRNLKSLLDDPEVYRKRLFLHSGDITDANSVYRVMKDVMPDEIYNLAAQADVQESFLQPTYSVNANGCGVINWLEAIRLLKPDTKFYQASTSELFGDTGGIKPQNESTPVNPQSPYAWGKYVGYQAVRVYRKAYGLYACNGILFNHESPRRGDDYLTRKVTKAVARIKLGLQKELRLGNLGAFRDWGLAPEYAEAEWLILQQPEADDYVIGTGETHTVQEWVEEAFSYAGLNWKDYVVIDQRLFRPAEVDVLEADARKAKEMLGWEPKTKFKELVHIMVDADIAEQSKYV